jgi:TonB family protein
MVVRSAVTLLVGSLAACTSTPHQAAAPAPACPNLVATTVVSADTQVYDTLSVSQRPTRISSPAVHYPDSLREAGLSGRVVIDLIVDASGRAEPTSLRVLSTTHRDFAAPALEVVLKSEFCPGIRDGHPVRVRVSMPLNFTIRRG